MLMSELTLTSLNPYHDALHSLVGMSYCVIVALVLCMCWHFVINIIVFALNNEQARIMYYLFNNVLTMYFRCSHCMLIVMKIYVKCQNKNNHFKTKCIFDGFLILF